MPLGVSEILYRKVKADHAFIVSETATVASGGTFNVHLKNPSGTGKTLWLAEISVTSNGEYVSRLHDGFSSSPSGGSDTEIQAVLLDSENVDNNGVASSSRNVSFTSNSTHAVGVGGGGGEMMSVGGQSKHVALAMEESREIVVEVENTSSNENMYAITLVYYESEAS